MIFDRNSTLVLLDNAICNREAQPGSRANLFGREERIKDALFESYRYTRASIAECNIHYVILHFTGNRNRFAWCICHCIACIRQQINEDLLQLDGVADD